MGLINVNKCKECGRKVIFLTLCEDGLCSICHQIEAMNDKDIDQSELANIYHQLADFYLQIATSYLQDSQAEGPSK